MFVSGFTIVRNAVRYDYPIVESILSILPLVDEMVVAVGDSSDQTRERVLSINSPKLRIIDTIWDEKLRHGGEILAQQTNLALDACKGDWCFYLQADEVIHERDHDCIRRAMQVNLNRRSVAGLSFRYHHFRADYAIRDPLPYRRQVRIVRPGLGVRSHGDACGFKIPDRRLTSVSTGAWVYHYGYVKPPSRMAAKMAYFSSLYDGRIVIPGEEMSAEDYEWDLRTCELFTKPHPQVMQARIAAKNWVTPRVQLVPCWRNSRFWSGLVYKNSRAIRRWASSARRLAASVISRRWTSVGSVPSGQLAGGETVQVAAH
jgi:glycosyltransferase involved in cell wall biosynthesis